MTRFVRLSAGRLVGRSALCRGSVCHNLHFLVPIGTLFSFIHYFTKAKMGDRQKDLCGHFATKYNWTVDILQFPVAE